MYLAGIYCDPRTNSKESSDKVFAGEYCEQQFGNSSEEWPSGNVPQKSIIDEDEEMTTVASLRSIQNSLCSSSAAPAGPPVPAVPRHVENANYLIKLAKAIWLLARRNCTRCEEQRAVGESYVCTLYDWLHRLQRDEEFRRNIPPCRQSHQNRAEEIASAAFALNSRVHNRGITGSSCNTLGVALSPDKTSSFGQAFQANAGTAWQKAFNDMGEKVGSNNLGSRPNGKTGLDVSCVGGEGQQARPSRRFAVMRLWNENASIESHCSGCDVGGSTCAWEARKTNIAQPPSKCDEGSRARCAQMSSSVPAPSERPSSSGSVNGGRLITNLNLGHLVTRATVKAVTLLTTAAGGLTPANGDIAGRVGKCRCEGCGQRNMTNASGRDHLSGFSQTELAMVSSAAEKNNNVIFRDCAAILQVIRTFCFLVLSASTWLDEEAPISTITISKFLMHATKALTEAHPCAPPTVSLTATLSWVGDRAAQLRRLATPFCFKGPQPPPPCALCANNQPATLLAELCLTEAKLYEFLESIDYDTRLVESDRSTIRF